jgi:beta-ketoacyl-acyl-carrier-protein synthase II
MATPHPGQAARVVISGIGMVTPLGTNLESQWQALLAGRSGIGIIEQIDTADIPCKIGGELKDFTPTDFMEAKLARRISRAAQMTLAAAKLALENAELEPPLPIPERTGVYIGTATGGVDKIEDGIDMYRERGFGRLDPFAAPAVLPNMLAFHVTEYAGALGPNSTIATACATGTQTVGEAFHVIRTGRADRMIAGGGEALIRDYVMAGFATMRALPTSFNDEPTRASRPFDAKREGFVLSEGAACLVLERLDLARERKAPIYAEVVGYASSNDAYHLAAPHPEAAGAVRTMEWALQDANLPPAAIDYINAHGTSTPANDKAETSAIKQVFGERAYQIPISSTKSMIGHPMGASGTVEAAVSALTIRENIIHPTINYEYPDPECDLDYVPNQARPTPVRTVLSNSFGLGGQNACLILQEINDL